MISYYKDLLLTDIVLYDKKDGSIVKTKLLSTTKLLLRCEGTGGYVVPIKKKDVVIFPITTWDMLRFIRRRKKEIKNQIQKIEQRYQKKMEKFELQLTEDLKKDIVKTKQRLFEDSFIEETIVDLFAYRLMDAANRLQPGPPVKSDG